MISHQEACDAFGRGYRSPYCAECAQLQGMQAWLPLASEFEHRLDRWQCDVYYGHLAPTEAWRRYTGDPED